MALQFCFEIYWTLVVYLKSLSSTNPIQGMINGDLIFKATLDLYQ